MSDDQKRVIAVYDTHSEDFPLKDIEYWIERRMRKSSLIPNKVFLIGEEIDVGEIVEKITDKWREQEKEYNLLRDREEYERLKKKFES